METLNMDKGRPIKEIEESNTTMQDVGDLIQIMLMCDHVAKGLHNKLSTLINDEEGQLLVDKIIRHIKDTYPTDFLVNRNDVMNESHIHIVFKRLETK